MSNPIKISVILPTRNPNEGRLARTLAGLETQTMLPSLREIILIDNGSSPAVVLTPTHKNIKNLRIVREERAGLTPARLKGIAESIGEFLIFVDDDNVLDPGYLDAVVSLFESDSRLGVAGGPVIPEFSRQPHQWTKEFWGLLALQDQGDKPQIAIGSNDAKWPAFAPVGAGLSVRRSAIQSYLAALNSEPWRKGLDRTRDSLASGGDNDIVYTLLKTGWDVGYFPNLRLTHLIPDSRLEAKYLGRLNRGIQRSWVRILNGHGANPWPAISPLTVPIRAIRAWMRCRAWRGPAEKIRFYGLLGRFEGQADLNRKQP